MTSSETLNTTTIYENNIRTTIVNPTVIQENDIIVCTVMFASAFILSVVTYTIVMCYKRRRMKEKQLQNGTIKDYQQINASNQNMCYSEQNVRNPLSAMSRQNLSRTDEDDSYEQPRKVPLWHYMEEINNLPPSVPLFPDSLAKVQLDGEGAYLILSDEYSNIPERQPSIAEKQPEELDYMGYLKPVEIIQELNQQNLLEKREVRATDNGCSKHSLALHGYEIRKQLNIQSNVSSTEPGEEIAQETCNQHKTIPLQEEPQLTSDEMCSAEQSHVYRSSVQIQLSKSRDRTLPKEPTVESATVFVHVLVE